MGRAIRGPQRYELFESASGGCVLVLVVLESTERPPSFRPTRLQRESLAVKNGGIVKAVFFAGFDGLLRKLLEGLRGLGW